MHLTFVTDVGETYNVEIDENMEIENIMALLEAECGIPVTEQIIFFEGQELSDPKKTIAQCGVPEHAMILLRKRVTVGGRSAAQDAEMMRLQVLGNPNLMRQLRETQPELAHAAQNDPQRFADILRTLNERQAEAEAQKRRETELLNADPYDVDAQRRIQEAIRQEAVMENLNHALEYSPEFFGRVHMLYIPIEVNGTKVKAFVDSGAQQTIMSPECAERCGIMRLIDTRFSGIAKGVGTAKILGRVHSAQLKIADLHLPCAFTIMEGRDVDLLFGLDMLKAHQACIDLEEDCLRIKGRTVKFLPEHELPDNARMDGQEPAETDPSTSSAPGASSTPGAASAPNTNSFPGTGNTVGGGATPSSQNSRPGSRPNPGTPFGNARNPTPNQLSGRPSPSPHASASGTPGANMGGARFPEKDIQIIMGMGVSRQTAIQTLEAAGGNVDLAASLLF